jgi:LPXTG-site transpeptidase (sortase) family protein
VSDTDDDTQTLAQDPNLTIDKAYVSNDDEDSSGTVSPNDTLHYTVTVTNTGNTTLTNVVVNDTRITPNTTNCASVPPGGTCVLTGTYVVQAGDVTAGQIDNTGSVEDDDVCPGAGVLVCEDPETVLVPLVANPDIEVLKYVSVDGGFNWLDANSAPGPAMASGTNPLFRFVVTNTGDVTLTGITLTDTDMGQLYQIDLSTLCTIPGSLAPGADFTCYGTLSWAAGQHQDTTTTGGDYSGAAYTDTDDAYYYGTNPGIVKSLDSTDQEFTLDDDAAIGEIVTYKVDVVVPPGTHASASLVDTMAQLTNGGLSFVDCLSISGEVGLSIPGGFDNVCSSPVFDGSVDADNIDPASIEYHRIVSFDLDGLMNTAGEDLTLTFLLRAVVLDNLGNVGLLGDQTILANTAVFNFDGTSLTSNVVNVDVVEPDLAISKTADINFIAVGSTPVTFTLDIAHTGISQADAFDLQLEDVLPTGLDYVASSLNCQPSPTYLAPDGGTCVESGGTISAYWSSFLESDVAQIQFQVTANASLPASGNVTNTATINWTSLECDDCGPTSTTSATQFVNSAPEWVSYRPKSELQVLHGIKYARITRYASAADPMTANVFSTERYFAPGSSVDTYGASDPEVLNPVGEPTDPRNPPTRQGGGFLLPVTGFAPGVVTELTLPDPLLATNLTLEIPSQKLSMPLVGVELKNGNWNVDSLWNQAGWLQKTAYPTFAGNSVITSHVVTADGKPGPFVRLKELQAGDRIYITGNGYRYMYVIRKVNFVQPNDISVFKHREKSWLTLITCDTYDEKTTTYQRRVSVEAELMQVDPIK